MNKATIIYGPARSGKSALATGLAKAYKNPVRIYTKDRKPNENPWFFDRVTENTDVIIVEDFNDIKNWDRWFTIIDGDITVNRKGKHPFTMPTPKLIFVTNDKPKLTGVSFTRRCDFVECTPFKYSDTVVSKIDLNTAFDLDLIEELDFKSIIGSKFMNGEFWGYADDLTENSFGMCRIGNYIDVSIYNDKTVFYFGEYLRYGSLKSDPKTKALIGRKLKLDAFTNTGSLSPTLSFDRKPYSMFDFAIMADLFYRHVYAQLKDNGIEIIEEINVKAEEVDPFSQFKLPNQRKFRNLWKIMELKETDQVPEKDKGKLLFILDNCRQLLIAKNEEVIISNQ